MDLTRLQANVLRYIIEFTLENLYQPSWREIAFKFDMDSTNEVTTVIDALIKKGYLGKHEERRNPRSLIIPDGTLKRYLEQRPTQTWDKVVSSILNLRGMLKVTNASSRT